MRRIAALLVAHVCLVSVLQLHADVQLTAEQHALVDEHVFGGIPTAEPIFVRQATRLCGCPRRALSRYDRRFP